MVVSRMGRTVVTMNERVGGVGHAERLAGVRDLTHSGQARKIRQHANLTRAEVARAVGVDPSTVSRWESGERRPRGTAAIRYAELLRRLSAERGAA